VTPFDVYHYTAAGNNPITGADSSSGLQQTPVKTNRSRALVRHWDKRHWRSQIGYSRGRNRPIYFNRPSSNSIKSKYVGYLSGQLARFFEKVQKTAFFIAESGARRNHRLIPFFDLFG